MKLVSSGHCMSYCVCVCAKTHAVSADDVNDDVIVCLSAAQATKNYQPGPNVRQQFSHAMRRPDDADTIITERTDRDVVSDVSDAV